jgi:hypothetical protein
VSGGIDIPANSSTASNMSIAAEYSIIDEQKPIEGKRGQRDLQVVRFIGRFGIVSLEHVMIELGCGRTAAYRRVARLIEKGLLERLDLVTDQPSVLRATKDGLRYGGLGLGVAQVSPGAVRHWLVCADQALNIARSLTDQGTEFVLLTQREVPFAERVHGEAIGRAKVHRSRSEPGPRWHNPDFVVLFREFGSGWKTWAYEIELNPKTPARLREIMTAWISSRWIEQVIYICQPGQTMRAVKRAIEKPGIGSSVSVHELQY